MRHTEISGSEIFEKFFVKNGRIVCAVYCIIGDNTEAFREATLEWLSKNGFKED